jgi:hypothetical protein
MGKLSQMQLFKMKCNVDTNEGNYHLTLDFMLILLEILFVSNSQW